MHLVELTVAGNEASDLLEVVDQTLLASLDARSAFWTVLDEGPVEACIALLVEHEQGWSAQHVAADAGVHAGKTEDAEALARHGDWVYVLGSHFGSKKGPLRPKRAFVARFRESQAPVLQIVRHRFALHRAINDALNDLTGTPTPEVHSSFIDQTRARGAARGKSWVEQLQHGDHPINIEGAAFTPRGTLLIGLRWPVTAAGEPILVELAGVPELFEGGAGLTTGLTVAGSWILTDLGPGPLGIRALRSRGGDEYDVVVGSIDALDKGSVLLDSHPEARDATCRHFRFALPEVRPLLVADLAPLHHVEGMAEWQGRPLYVTDENHRVALYQWQ